MVNYEKINVGVNSQYIMCENASLSQEGKQEPLYVLGNSSPISKSPTNINHTFSVRYDIETENEPNYKLISGWKNYGTGNLTAIINFGDVFFTGYLNDYSFEILPNQTIKANASYSVFHEITGNLANQNPLDSGLYNNLNSSGRASYGRASFTSNGSNIINNEIIQLKYQFNSNLLPKYKIGNPVPHQVMTLSAHENIETLSETQNNVIFTGNVFQNLFSNIDTLKIENLANSLFGVLFYNLSGFNLDVEKVDVSANNIILFNSQFNKYY